MTHALCLSRERIKSTVGRSGQSKRANVASRCVRVLLVEDHSDTARAMWRLLRAQGFAVDCATTCTEAIQAIGASRYDLLVSDIGLPDGTGFDLMRHARAAKGRGGIAGIALSGFGLEHNIRRSKQAGFAVHFTKPLNIQQLIESIERLTCESIAAQCVSV